MPPEFVYAEPDFEAQIEILAPELGGRSVPARNQLRWDFAYANDAGYAIGGTPLDLFMIYPNFLTATGHPLSKEAPISGTMNAHMHIVLRDRLPVHQGLIKVGTRFNCHEGAHIVAKGVVTRLIGLAQI
ncbi:hypothetical protein [Shimia sagamensis]|uniref:Uncharacterized protein n=1 Tax=Shimia sagamensis TaxID=1566352 RepID=A0ABY1P034_9RHOB|nr:hypothetical protein [Shimia sagamensis]SMP20492.1 hypothetical protein SAMN06265373_103534 [Shimia sagamensis]